MNTNINLIKMRSIILNLVLLINIIYAERPGDIRQHKILNSCKFDIVRLKRNEISCVDFGLHKKYCDHPEISKEFVITKENGIVKNTIIIKPEAMYEEVNGQKYIMAKFYYSFNCNYYERIPKLELSIVPTPNYDKSINEEIPGFISIIILIIFIILLISLICPCLFKNNIDFTSGLFIGNILGGSNSNRLVYCE